MIRKVPLGNKIEGGPQPIISYKNNLNQSELTANAGGPKCGKDGHTIGFTSLLRGAIDTNKLKSLHEIIKEKRGKGVSIHSIVLTSNFSLKISLFPGLKTVNFHNE